MNIKAGYSTPMLHVKSIEDSIAFYKRLGFEVVDKDGCEPLGWARIHCEGGALMFLRAEEEPIDPQKQGVMFFMYTPDLPAMREELAASGVQVPAIDYPAYLKSGEMRLVDPDGFVVYLAHWSDKEHEEWEKNRQPG